MEAAPSRPQAARQKHTVCDMVAPGVGPTRPARAARILGPLARAATPCLGGFTPQELASTAWAFATAGVADAPDADK